jgi:hypothetical protein
MNELSTAIHGVPELRNWKRMNAAATPVAGFKYRDLLAGAPEFTRCHQASGAGANDDDVFWLPPGHAGFSGLCSVY